MASISWKSVSGDWSNAADWSGGVLPGSGDTASFAGGLPYTVTLYGAAAVAGMAFNAPGSLFYDAGSLTVAGTLMLQAGTLALAYGSLDGGTLALLGGTLQASGGVLNGVAVQGTLSLAAPTASLFVENGLTLGGAGGVGAGALAVTGTYATLDFLGTQSLANAVVTLGAVSGGPGQGGPASIQVQETYGASSGATLTLAANVWLRQAGQLGQLIAGGALPGPYVDAIVNAGTMTASTPTGTLLVSGGDFINQGTIGISNGATLDIASAGFTNTGTISVASATLDFGGTFASSLLGSLGALSLSQAVVEIGGDALNAGNTLTIGSGTPLGPLLLAGTITGGTILDLGGGLNLSAGTGLLDGAVYGGNLSLGAGAALTLADNAALSSITGGSGNASITGAGAALLLQGTTTLNNATLSLGSSSGVATIATSDAWLAGTATQGTLGAGLTIRQTGKYAGIDANSTSPVADFGLADTLVNDGTISAAFAGGTLAIAGGGTFINAGLISGGGGDALLLDPAVFSNTGTISLGGGASAQLGGPTNAFGQTPTWSNSGAIYLSSASLTLAGALTTNQIGTIRGANGTVTLAGTLANLGSTLTLGPSGNVPNATLTGTITGGTIADPNGLLSIGSSGTALLDGVTDTGNLTLANAGAFLRIRNGLTLYGTATLAGAGADLDFQGTQTFDKAWVAIGAGGQAAVLDVLQDFSSNTPSTLTLGPSLAITQTGALAAIGSANDFAGTAINSYAFISASVAAGTFALGGANFTNRGTIAVSNFDTLLISAGNFTNSGSISVSNAYLAVADSLNLSALGKVTLTNAALSVSGTLNIGGGTLAIGAGSTFGRLGLTGQITGGAILDTGQGLAAGGNATLNGVTYDGTLDLSRPFQQLTIINGIALSDITGTQAGTILLTGAASRLIAAGSEAITNATILLGSASQTYYGQHVPPPELAAGVNSALTLGPAAVVRSAGLVGWLGDCSVGNWTDSITNQGTILAVTSGGILTLGSTFFVNTGSLSASSGGNFMFNGAGFSNQGTISIAAGSDLMIGLYSYYAAPNAPASPFTNSGTVQLAGGVLQELTGNGLFPAVPVVNSTGATISGMGNIVTPVLNNGLIVAQTGPNLSIAGSITGTGTMQVGPNCVLELNGPVAASQTVGFTSSGETLRLDQSQVFGAHVAGFATGDVLDIGNTPVTNVGISSGTLVLGTGTGQFRLNSGPLAGALSIGTDHRGGDTVLYTQQAPGSGAATLGVPQSGMLFWASPAGDIFTGPTADLQGAEIFNWSTADSIDLTDFLGAKATVAYTQSTGQGTLTATDGTHADTVILVGTYTASWFHAGLDGHGGALLTYSHS